MEQQQQQNLLKVLIGTNYFNYSLDKNNLNFWYFKVRKNT